MKKIILLFFLSFIISNVYLDVYLLENKYKIKNENHIETRDINKSVKALLYSSIIPGAGQYFVNKNKTKGLIFLGLELLAIAGYRHYLNEADFYKNQYQSYGDSHWNFVTWCNNYYNWEDPDNDFFNVFANDVSMNYPDIWEDSHHIDFTYNDNGIVKYVSSSSSAFEELYINENLDNVESAQDFYNNNDVIIRRDHHFYENISKYNHFFAGWEDHSEITLYDNNGYVVATSPLKQDYKSIYDKSVKNYKIKNQFISFIFLNHFISALDALIISKIYDNSTNMIINYNPRMDFYQAQLSIKLN